MIAEQPERRPFAPHAVTEIAVWIVALMPVVVFLLPVLRTGYLFDDIYNSYFPAEAHLRGLSVGEYALRITRVYIDEQGRFYPFAFFQTYGLLSFLPLYLYKLTLVGLTVLDAVLAMVLLRMLRVPRFAVLLFPLAFCATLQMRAFLDPLLGFAGLMQMVAALTLGSGILFVSYLRRPRPAALAGSLLLLAIACMEYEAALTFGLLYPALALAERRGWRAVLRASLPPIAVTLVFIGLAIALRLRVGNHSEYRADLSIEPALWAFAHQFSGAVPLSYFAVADPQFGPRGAFIQHRFTITGNSAFLLSALLAGAVVVCDAGRARGEVLVARVASTAGLAGLALAIAPVLLLSISPRWQPNIRFGVAYIPVEIQGIGIAVLLVVLAWFLVTAARRGLHRSAIAALTCLAVIAVASVTFLANDAVVDAFVPGKAARAFEEDSLSGGLLDAYPRSAAIVPDPFNPWASQAGFFYAHARRRLTVAPLSALASALPTCAWKFSGSCAPYARALLYRVGRLPSGRFVGLACPLRVEGAGATRSLVCAGTATVVLGPPGEASASCAAALITAGSTAPSRLVVARGGRVPGHGITVCHGVIRVPLDASVVSVVEG